MRIIFSYLFHQVIHYPSIGRITNKQNLWNKKPILLALRYLGKAKKCATKEHPWRRFANLFLSQTRFGVFVGQNVMRTRVRGPLGFTPETRAWIAAACAWKHPGTCWKMFIRLWKGYTDCGEVTSWHILLSTARVGEDEKIGETAMI